MKYIAQRVLPNSTNFPGENSQKMYMIVSVASGNILGVNEGNGDTAQKIWRGDKRYLWRFEPTGDGYYFIRNVVSDKVIDVYAFDGSNGARLTEWALNRSANQQWKVEHLGNGKFTFRSRHTGKMIDLHAGLKDENNRIQQWEWISGNANQQWVLTEIIETAPGSNFIPLTTTTPAAGKMYMIAPVTASNMVAGVDSNSYVVQKGWNGSKRYLWTFEATDSGYYVVRNAKTNRAWDVMHWGTGNGARILSWDCHKGNNQQWRLEHLGEGKFRFIARHSGKSLDIDAGRQTEDTVIQQYDWHGGANQQWRVSEVILPDANALPTVYEHPNYQGRKQKLTPGKYNLRQLAVGNDQISSLKVPDGYRVSLFADMDYSGQKREITSNVADLVNNFDNQASSIIVEQVAQLFENANYTGNSQTVGVGSYARETWYQLPGKLKWISVAADGAMWGVNSANQVFRSDGTTWVLMDGGLSQIAVGNANYIWGVNTVNDIYVWMGDRWMQVAGKLKNISAASDGTVWGIAPDESIHRFRTDFKQKITLYEHPNYQGRSKELALGEYRYITDFNDIVSSIRVPLGYRVTVYEHPDYAGRSRVYTSDINSTSGFHDVVSSVKVDFSNDCWVAVPGRLSQISTGSKDHVWGVNSSDEIFKRNGDTWELIGGRLRNVSVDYQGQVWGVNSAGAIFKYLGSNQWQTIEGSLKQITVGNEGLVYGVNSSDDILQRCGLGNKLTLPDNAVSSVKVPRGMVLTLFEHPNFTGKSRVILENQTYVGNDNNDITSAISLSYMGTPIPPDAFKFGDKFALRAFNGKIVSGEIGGSFSANRDSIQSWEEFTIYRAGETKYENIISFGDVVAIQTVHGKYLSTNANGGAWASNTTVGEAEKFIIIRAGESTSSTFVCPDDKVSFLSVPQNKLMVAVESGAVNVNHTTIGDWERWTIIGRQPEPVASAEEEEGICGSQACGVEACGADVTYFQACGANACGVAVCGAKAAGFDICGAAYAGISACAAAAAGIGVCGVDLQGITACGADACGIAACGAAVSGISACGANVAGISVCGAAVSGITACGAAAVGISACGVAASGVSACGALADLIAVCAVEANLVDTCAAKASLISACSIKVLDACAANVCAIDICPIDACAADACAIDIIPIIPGI